MTVPEPTYITAAEAKEQSFLSAIASMGEENLTKLLRIAEDHVDLHCRPQPHHPCDDNTIRVFPRVGDEDEDGNPEIPYQVSKATLAQLEHIVSEWWDERTTSLLPFKHEAEEVDVGGDGSYREKLGKGGSLDGKSLLCEQAQLWLVGFVSRTTSIDVTDPCPRDEL